LRARRDLCGYLAVEQILCTLASLGRLAVANGGCEVDHRYPGDRTITWEGFYNARDLGGLPTRDGRWTQRRRFVRSADLRFVTEKGWREALDAGIRTIIDLRNDDEAAPADGPGLTTLGGTAKFDPEAAGPFVPAGIARVHVPLDGVEDVEFWRHLNDTQVNGTPLYFRPFLTRKPARCASAVSAVARARHGGIIFHCGAGRDRTGLLTLLLLRLANVEPQVIADDYELSTAALAALFSRMGREDEAPRIAEILAAKGTTARAAVLDACEELDAEPYLLDAGAGPADIATVRARLLEVDVVLAENGDRAAQGRRRLLAWPILSRSSGSSAPPWSSAAAR